MMTDIDDGCDYDDNNIVKTKWSMFFNNINELLYKFLNIDEISEL